MAGRGTDIVVDKEVLAVGGWDKSSEIPEFAEGLVNEGTK